MPDDGVTPPITLLVLAAGASSRMRGADKLIEPVGGRPLLRHVVKAALGSGAPVFVTLNDRPARWAAISGLAVTAIAVTDAADGMGASLRAGVAAIAPDHAIMVLLADMPEIDTADIAAVLNAFRMAPMVLHRGCAADGTPGHPVVFPPWARDDLLCIGGDAGAKPVLKAHAQSIRLVPLPGTHAVTDLDTPEAWAAWRAARPEQ